VEQLATDKHHLLSVLVVVVLLLLLALSLFQMLLLVLVLAHTDHHFYHILMGILINYLTNTYHHY
jgi:hypothetical protein